MKPEDMNEQVEKPECKSVAKPVADRAMPEPTAEVGENGRRAEARPDPTKRRPNSLSRSILPVVWLGLWLGLALRGQGATVTGTLLDLHLNGLQTPISFSPTNLVLVTTGGLSAGPTITTVATNGAFSTVLDAGDYTVCLPLVPGRKCFGISVPNDSNTYNITNLLSQAAGYVYTGNYLTIDDGTEAGDILLTDP